jgi:hypothetical protein
MNARNFVVVVVMALMCAACSLYEIGKPSLSAGDRWIKSGLNREQVRQAYLQCGYSDLTWTMQMQANIDECMLKNGFTFIDSPYQSVHRQCKDIYPEFQRLPSCQSLQNKKTQ